MGHNTQIIQISKLLAYNDWSTVPAYQLQHEGERQESCNDLDALFQTKKKTKKTNLFFKYFLIIIRD